MRDTIFYTEISIPRGATFSAVQELKERLGKLRSVYSVELLPKASTIRIIVGGSQHSLRFSDCPFPGTHDFAAGWLANEAMMAVSCIFEQPTAWAEGEIVGENLSLPNGHVTMRPVRKMRDDKPTVLIDYKGFLEAHRWRPVTRSAAVPRPFSQGGTITGPGQP